MTLNDEKLVTIRRATASDAAHISVLYLHFLQSYGHDAEGKDISRFVRWMLGESWVLFFVAIDRSNNFLGFAGCTLNYSAVSLAPAISISDLFVETVARRRGIATALCGAIEAHARESGFAKIFVEAAVDAETAISMYKKFGFEQQPFLSMRRELRNV